MRVEFVWPYAAGKTAAALLEKYFYAMVELPLRADYRTVCFANSREEVLSVEIPGLAATSPDRRHSWSKRLFEINQTLQDLGVNPAVTIDGNSLWFYAGDREYRAEELKAAGQLAVDELKATRGWFKSEKLARIRRALASVVYMK